MRRREFIVLIGSSFAAPAGSRGHKFQLVINLKTAKALGSRYHRHCRPPPTRQSNEIAFGS